MIHIRVATSEDVRSMLEIYGQVVLETVISWEYEVPSQADFSDRLGRIQNLGFPWICTEESGQIQGYCYASPFRERYGYRFGCESTIYVRAGQRGSGLGRKLYECLFEILRRQSFAVVIAGIAHPNPESQGFHEKLGFERVGLHERIGYKFGSWHSVAFYQRDLVPRDSIEVEAPIRFNTLYESGQLADLVS